MAVHECTELAWYQQKEHRISTACNPWGGGDRVASYNKSSCSVTVPMPITFTVTVAGTLLIVGTIITSTVRADGLLLPLRWIAGRSAADPGA